MRDQFHADLAALATQLVTMATAVADAMREASAVLLEPGTASAAEVIAADLDINALELAVDDQVIDLMTRQQPVAGDLRLMVAAIRISTDLERMGDMAKHVAKLARRSESAAARAELADVYRPMAAVASRIADKTVGALRDRDRLDAAQLDLDDDEMDALFSRLLTRLASGWTHSAEAAVDAAMLGRSYERYADHAVRVGHQVVYLVTGEQPMERPR